ncbi:hypothetical protein [Paraflavitalea speifideaquila]|uniref:hypothetical protein n=1 Tax=Paraflavitalea speifideaquila TaxID=3076558 RepID=UPI0028E71DEB|nr:hypothetical protein [Paraflavitalea speifideiaquila]
MKVNIHCLNGNGLDIENHYNQKEYRDDIVIEIDGMYFEVYFFLPHALEYEMTIQGYYSLPGLILLDDITFDKICSAINKLLDFNYFDQFKGSSNGPEFDRFFRKWLSDTGSIPREDRSVVYALRE